MEYYLEVEFKGKFLKGILIKEDKEHLTLKLNSGYNANLKKSNIKELKREKREIKTNSKKETKTNNKDLPNITILHTGGTIASKVDYKTGAVSSKFTPEELLALYPEFKTRANITPKMIANLSSEDMRFDHYNLLLKAIKEADKDTSGIIISHGTDTMHYTAAALQYALKNLNIPIILVGAQRSSDRASSDAFSNLKAAIDFIIDNKDKTHAFRRVGICMHKSIEDNEFQILDAFNAKKMHSSRRDAFKQINYLPYATIKDNIEIHREELQTLEPEEKLKILPYKIKLKIGFFKAHPNLFPEEIEALKIYDGVVIEGTGLGHIVVSEFDNYTKINKENLEATKKLMKTTKVVIGVQTVYGQTNMNIYSSGRYLKDTGIKGQFMNLTTETLFCRLAFCLSQKEDFNKLWEENLEGFDTRNIEIEE